MIEYPHREMGMRNRGESFSMLYVALREFRIGSEGLRMRLDNATMHLLLTGMLQGVFDATYDVDSNVEWKLTEEESLEAEVQPCA